MARRKQTGPAYATRLRGAGNNADADGERGLHLINMYQDLLELKYYITNYDSIVDGNETHDANQFTNNMLAMRLKITDDNGLNALPNSYNPESTDTEKQWIMIEICNEKDMTSILSAIQRVRIYRHM